MKIQLQNTFFHPQLGGIENYLYNAGLTLAKLGHEPQIVCSRHSPALPEREIYHGMEVLRHPEYAATRGKIGICRSVTDRFFYHRYIHKLRTFIGDAASDCSIIWSRHPHYCYASIGDSVGTPVIYIQATAFPLYNSIWQKHANHSVWSRWVYGVYNNKVNGRDYSIEREAMERCHRIVVLSQARKREIMDYYRFSGDKFTVVPPGVDLETFKPRKKDEALQTELGIPQDAAVILGVGRLSAEKNFEFLFEAFKQLNEKNTYLVIVGDGPDREILNKKSVELGIKDFVRLPGYRSDTVRFYSLADVFVLPSTYEGFGQVLIEAMASGVPSIGLRDAYPEVSVATGEIIDDGVTGYLVDPYKSDDLASKLSLMIRNRDLVREMGTQARRQCEKRYSWIGHVKTMLSITAKALNLFALVVNFSGNFAEYL